MRSLIRDNVPFRRLWTAGIVSQIGDWLSYVVVSLMALDLGEGAMAVALVLVAHTLPHALLAPVGGLVADRYDRRSVVVVAALVRGALTLGMVVAAWIGVLDAVLALVFVRASVGALALPASNALLPRVVARDDLRTANALLSGTWSVMFTFGMALGGLLAPLGATVALTLDAATFVLAAALLARLPAQAPAEGGRLQPLRDLVRAARVAGRDRHLLRAVLAKSPLSLAAGGAWVLLNLRADQALLAAGLTLGLLHAARGIGTALGPLALGERYAGFDLFGFAGMLVFAWTESLPVLVVAALVWGVGVGANWVGSMAELQLRSPDAVLGRLGALDGLLMTLAMAVSALGGATLADHVGLAWAGTATVAAGAFTWLALWSEPWKWGAAAAHRREVTAGLALVPEPVVG